MLQFFLGTSTAIATGIVATTTTSTSGGQGCAINLYFGRPPPVCPDPLVWQPGFVAPDSPPPVIWAEWIDSGGVRRRGQLDTNPSDPPLDGDIDWITIVRWIDINAINLYAPTPDPSCPDVIPWQPGGAEGGDVPSLTPVFAVWTDDLGITVHGEVDVSTTDPSGDVDWAQIEGWVDPGEIA